MTCAVPGLNMLQDEVETSLLKQVPGKDPLIKRYQYLVLRGLTSLWLQLSELFGLDGKSHSFQCFQICTVANKRTSTLFPVSTVNCKVDGLSTLSVEKLQS